MATSPDPAVTNYKGPYIDPSLTNAPKPWGPFGSTAITPTTGQTGAGKADPDPVEEPGTQRISVITGAISGATPVHNQYDHTRVYDNTKVIKQPGNPTAVVPPYSPNSWAIDDYKLVTGGISGAPLPGGTGSTGPTFVSFGKDYYRNGGMIGKQDATTGQNAFLKNQG